MAVILVTGAAGFIGSHVTERLLCRGDTVIGLDNFDPFYARAIKLDNLAQPLAQPGFCLVEVDLRDAEALRSVVERYRPQAIVHLAAKAGVRPSIEDPLAYVETNITGTLNLLRCC